MNADVCVIGGGASGMMAAITSARNKADTVLIEHGERVGRKLVITGNGKCNFTNRNMRPACYHASADSFEMKAVSLFGPQDAIDFFRSVGVEPLEGKDGCIYPNSEQAASVLNALRMEMERLHIRVMLSFQAEEIKADGGNGFLIRSGKDFLNADCLILAMGSPVRSSTGSDGSGYRIAESFGHTLNKPLPALCSLTCSGKDFFREAEGVRVKASIRIECRGKVLDGDAGELQIASNGLSGIPAFQVSRTAARLLDRKEKVSAVVDFLPHEENVFHFLMRRRDACPYPDMEAFGNGLLNKKLWTALLKLSGIRPGLPCGEVTEEMMKRLSEAVKNQSFLLTGTGNFANAQTCTGGIRTNEVSPLTMESLKKKNLFLAGEILDADGICGGYNLQWAWTSGYLAGKAASAAAKEKTGALNR